MSDSGVIERIFSKIDADKSGSICETELQSAFKDFDHDANGSISREEWIDDVVAQFGATKEQALTMFNKLDCAGQGQIALEELNRLFKKMDADGNGTVTKDEFFEFWSKLIKA